MFTCLTMSVTPCWHAFVSPSCTNNDVEVLPSHTLVLHVFFFDHLLVPPAGDEDNSAEGWRALTLYTQQLGDTVLHLLLSSAAPSNPQLVYTLVRNE